MGILHPVTFYCGICENSAMTSDITRIELSSSTIFGQIIGTLNQCQFTHSKCNSSPSVPFEKAFVKVMALVPPC